MLSRSLRSLRVNAFALRAHVRYNTSVPEGPNEAILDMLRQNKHEEDQRHDRNGFKVRAFNAAITAIEGVDHPIRSADEAKQINGIGAGIARRIHDFLSGEEFPKETTARRRKEEEKRKARILLEQVSGIGAARSKDLVASGCRTIEDLWKPQHFVTLTPPQQIGLKYHDQLRQPVEREEIELIADFIRQNISTKYEVIVAGSYRRGFPISEDIHMLLLHPDHVHIPIPTQRSPSSSTTKLLVSRRGRPSATFRKSHTSLAGRNLSLMIQDVVPVLRERGLIAAQQLLGEWKWTGVVRVPEPDVGDDRMGERKRRLQAIQETQGRYRLLDLNLVPMKSRGAALLSLTGDSEFIRDLRLRANKMGMHLNEFGLWRWRSNTPSEGSSVDADHDIGFWELIKAETEEEIMDQLGMSYIDPVKRNFSYVARKGTKTKTSRELGPVLRS